MPKSKKVAVAKPVSEGEKEKVEDKADGENPAVDQDSVKEVDDTGSKKTNGRKKKAAADGDADGDAESKKQRERFSGQAMRRLATNAGFASVAKEVYPTLRHVAMHTLEVLVQEAWIAAQAAKRVTIGKDDVDQAVIALGIGTGSRFSGLPADIVASLSEALPTVPIKKKAEEGAAEEKAEGAAEGKPAKKGKRKAKAEADDAEVKDGDAGADNTDESGVKRSFAKNHVEETVRSTLEAIEAVEGTAEGKKPRLGAGSADAFHATLEAYLVDLFEDAVLIAWSRKACTLSQAVLSVTLRIRGIF